jgi:hypothetical protein
VNFAGEYGITITGAQNINVPGVSHMGIVESPTVQKRTIESCAAPNKAALMIACRAAKFPLR